jgi:hypothetical protein
MKRFMAETAILPAGARFTSNCENCSLQTEWILEKGVLSFKVVKQPYSLTKHTLELRFPEHESFSGIGVIVDDSPEI